MPVVGGLGEVGRGEGPGEVGVGFLKLLPFQLVAHIPFNFAQAAGVHGHRDDHPHYGVAVREVVVGEVEIGAALVQDVPHGLFGFPGELLGVVVDDDHFPAAEGAEPAAAFRDGGYIHPAAEDAHTEPAVGVVAEAVDGFGQGSAVHPVAHSGLNGGEADGEFVVQPGNIAGEAVVGDEGREALENLIGFVGVEGAGQLHGLFVSRPGFPAHILLEDVFPGEEDDGQEDGFGELLDEHFVEDAAQFGVSAEAEPLQDDLGRGADFLGAPGYGVDHLFHIPVDEAVVVLEGVGVAQEAVHFGQVAGEDDRQVAAAVAAHGAGFAVDFVDGALVAVVHHQALDAVQDAGFAHALGPAPAALVAGGAHGDGYDGRRGAVAGALRLGTQPVGVSLSDVECAVLQFRRHSSE